MFGSLPDPQNEQREEMVKSQLVPRGIRDERVLQAMRRVPRHLFVDEKMAKRAYDDSPLHIGEGQTISQPYIVALMSEALALTGAERVLEIGTGSGYQAAILSHLAARVFSVERIASLAREAQGRLAALGIANVEVIIGDGAQGYPQEAPFDAIIVTAAAQRVPNTLLGQVAKGGRLVVPVDYEQDLFSRIVGRGEVQRLLKITRTGAGALDIKSENICDCRFVRLIGEH